jgi:uncharacterized protein YndB with AHSA1/START domain
MRITGKLKLTTPNDRDIVMTREFAAPRALVFQALIKPDLLKRWLLGPPGWSMVVCEMDPRMGGAYRYVWRHDAGGSVMGMGGVIREIVPAERIVVTEKFDESWYPGEALNTTVLTEQGDKTILTLTVRYESKAARDAVLKTPMDQGVAASFDRLAGLLETSTPGGARP